MTAAKKDSSSRNGIIERPRVDKLLLPSLHRALTTVIAPPGYSKSTSTFSFVEKQDIPHIWINLSVLDNNIQSFSRKVTQAFHPVCPQLARVLEKAEMPDTFEKYRDLVISAETLLKELGPLIIVFDNYDLITNSKIHLFLNHSINVNLTEAYSWSYIIISNSRLLAQQGPFSDSLSSIGDIHTISTADLAFTMEETRRLMHARGKEMHHYQIKKVREKTDGWPFYLAMISENRSEDNIIDLSSRLFETQYFSHYSPEIKRSLTELALLPRFSLEILAQLHTADLENILENLVENVFIDIDHKTQLYRMQTPYRSFLAEKSILITQEEQVRIKNLAGDWFYKKALYHDALELYMETNNYDRLMDCASMLMRSGFNFATERKLHTVLKNISIAKPCDPRALFYLGLTYLNNGEVNQAKACFEEIVSDPEFTQNDHFHEMLGDSHRILTDISLIQNELTGLDHINKAIEYLPHGSSIVSKKILGVRENTIFFMPDKTEKSVSEVVQYVKEVSYQRNKIYNGSLYGYEYLFEAEAKLVVGDMSQSRTSAEQAIRKAISKSQHDIVLLGHALIIESFIVEGNYAKAKAEIVRFDAYYEESIPAVFSDLRDLITASFYMKTGNDQSVASWIKEADYSAYEEKPLWIGRNVIVSSWYFLAKRDFVRSLSLLALLDDAFDQRGLWRGKLMAHICKAIAYLGLHDVENALDEFWMIHEMSAPYGIYYPTAEVGSPLEKLIDLAKNTTEYSFDVEWLNELSRKTHNYAEATKNFELGYQKDKPKTQHTMTLSDREIYALDLLSRGLTREEMAETTGVTVHAIKKQLASIYRKLGAKNRSEAIYIATMNGVLSN